MLYLQLLLTRYGGLTSAYRTVGDNPGNGISVAAYEYDSAQISWDESQGRLKPEIAIEMKRQEQVVFLPFRVVRKRMRGSDHLAGLNLLFDLLEEEGKCQVTFSF